MAIGELTRCGRLRSKGGRALARRWGKSCAAAIVALSALAAAPTARACGGCFGVGASNAPVVGHRMAFALSQGRTVLWDQFEYSGAPEEFSWVLPVAPGAYLEESSDAWFETLEAYTQVSVSPPPLNCASGGSSGCGTMASADSAALEVPSAGEVEPTVSVLRRETVGPYETVTLRSTSGNALSGWLVDNGYVIPPDIVPIIEAYVSEGADFIALRLRPGAGVTQMTPVRVVTPGGTPVLPLRMVAAGVGEWVDIVLYLIGEQRYAMPDLVEVEPDLASLSFDFRSNVSNYPELQRKALARNEGHVFLTAYAWPGDFAAQGTRRAVQTTGGTSFASDPVSLYFQQSLENQRAPQVSRCNGVAERARTDRRVIAGCESSEGSECPAPGADELVASELVCDQFDDVAAALIGQRPAHTWLTRLELRLPRQALSIDCVIEPNFDQSTVSSALQAERFTNPPCDLPVFSSSLGDAPGNRASSYLLAAAVLGMIARRAGKRRG